MWQLQRNRMQESTSRKLGFLAVNSNGRTIASHNQNEIFPLACAAKVFIAAVTVVAVKCGRLSWNHSIRNLEFDPKEDSHLLYPHLQGQYEYRLSDVVEVMIACHDHHCATAIANLLGGWDELSRLISVTYPRVQVCNNVENARGNSGCLEDAINCVSQIAEGHLQDEALWNPVVAGLARQADKTSGIPPNCQWNMTGGLPNAVIDMGILGDLRAGKYVVYTSAAKELPNNESRQQAEATLISYLHQVYVLN